ncbi:MAG: WG repeat-containing protein [Oscillospiraceae bacterium]|nr:WG repeat-containing protein [Oscillospiraceae bacterium]
MKKKNLLVVAIMIALLALGWVSTLSGSVSQRLDYRRCIKQAESSVEEGLYEQAIEFYKEALTYGQKEEIWLAIRDVYEILYAEEHITFFRNCYIDDMALAAQAFPDNELFWVTQANLYLETQNYSNAFKVVQHARNLGVRGETLDALHHELIYRVKVDFKCYEGIKTALNGYHTVLDGDSWRVLDDLGEAVTSSYRFIGLINDSGWGLYTNNIDTRFLDSTEVTRARYDFEVEEAGYYHASLDLIPVKVNDSWKYMKFSGEYLPGAFEVAGSYYNNQAVARTGGKWVLLDEKGNQTDLSRFEDIVLDLYVCHIQGEVILAKENGKYHLYDTSFKQIGDFAADDVDICVNSGYIAFQQNGKWGFVDTKGNVVLEPQYANAKSFANGYAAVCNDEGLWGFITDDFELVIDYAYVDALYFTAAETCWVSLEEGTFQLLKFVF